MVRQAAVARIRGATSSRIRGATSSGGLPRDLLVRRRQGAFAATGAGAGAVAATGAGTGAGTGAFAATGAGAGGGVTGTGTDLTAATTFGGGGIFGTVTILPAKAGVPSVARPSIPTADSAVMRRYRPVIFVPFRDQPRKG
jgi:hypothetical protein